MPAFNRQSGGFGRFGIADDPQKVASLDNDLACLAERHLADSTAMDWEYLIITARKR